MTPSCPESLNRLKEENADTHFGSHRAPAVKHQHTSVVTLLFLSFLFSSDTFCRLQYFPVCLSSALLLRCDACLIHPIWRRGWLDWRSYLASSSCSDHMGGFGGPRGANTSQRRPGCHKGIIIHHEPECLIHHGALKKAVSTNIHALSNSSQILLVPLMSYFTANPHRLQSPWI